ncbi:MAG: ATP-binding protein [Bacteroidales bacterium]|nr:ATP-binding protein [Bacteroidales bacterium]
MLKRKIINTLSEWQNSTDKNAILLKGARQVGKTTIIRDFGNSHYEHFVEINFEQSKSAMQAFEGDRDAKTIIKQLSIMGYGPFVPHKTLVFFDEIQSCPNARTAIKFLVEDGQFDYIESGSLLGINYKDVSSYPVGFEEQIDMYPLDFEEFLWAMNVGEDAIDMIREAYNKNTPLPDFVHEQMMKYYRNYLIVGGMPQVVNTFVNNKDFAATLKVQRKIINSYRDDIAKYAGNQKVKAKAFFDAIPTQLAKEKKRFQYSDIEENAKSRDYEDAAQWLADAGTAYFSYNLNAMELPFEFHEKRNLFKVFLIDTGLLCSMWNEKIQFKVMNGEIDINEGGLTENFVAAELAKKGYKLHYYDKQSRQELDFVMQDGNKISVIEVKSGKRYKQHASLDNILVSDGKKIEHATVLSRFNLSEENGIKYLPLYMTMFM